MKRTRNHPYIHGWRGIRPKKRGPRPKSGLKDCQSSQLPQVRHYLLSFLLWQQLDHPLRWMSTHQSRFPKPKKLESICTMSTLGVKRWGLNQIFFPYWRVSYNLWKHNTAAEGQYKYQPGEEVYLPCSWSQVVNLENRKPREFEKVWPRSSKQDGCYLCYLW